MDARRKGEQIEIYTDANARVPELDESEDNPFVGRRKREAPKPQSSRRRWRPAEEVEMEERMKEAVKREEGVTYVLYVTHSHISKSDSVFEFPG